MQFKDLLIERLTTNPRENKISPSVKRSSEKLPESFALAWKEHLKKLMKRSDLR
ncbi:MAG: hypothetical protein HQM10_03995 [Candidatus Riflebacteria bacterium]|nr:hypothetical protein [Candidatus Riflebacteria bacterium]